MRLPEGLCRQAASILRQRYAALLFAGEEITVAGSTEEGPAEARIVVEDRGDDRRTEVSVRVAAEAGGTGAEGDLDLALDAAEALLGEWLEGGREERHPIDFVSYHYQGREVQVRVRRSRPSLEEAAARLLEKDGLPPEESL